MQKRRLLLRSPRETEPGTRIDLHVAGGGPACAPAAMTGFIVAGPLQRREVHAGDDERSGFLHMPPTA